jgi:hypothetical protein
MTKVRVFGLLACPAVFAALMAAGPAFAANQQNDSRQADHQGGDRGRGDDREEHNVRCQNQALGAVTIDGNLVVPSGAFCDLNGTHVTGNATVKSGPPEPSSPTGLNSNGATIDGNVLVQRNAQFAAFSSSTIGDDVQCDRCEVADVQDSTVKGNQEENGVSEGAFIRNSHIVGNLKIQNGTDFFNTGFHIDGNTIGRSLVFNRNTTSTFSDITGNAIAQNLICNDNTPPPIGGGNTAQHKQGQCALL